MDYNENSDGDGGRRINHGSFAAAADVNLTASLKVPACRPRRRRTHAPREATRRAHGTPKARLFLFEEQMRRVDINENEDGRCFFICRIARCVRSASVPHA